jgi:LPXTG-motif cell wall-anchored protein
MKLRHVLATAVASAVIAPTALLAAPAYATDETPEPDVSATAPAEEPAQTPDAEIVVDTPAEETAGETGEENGETGEENGEKEQISEEEEGEEEEEEEQEEEEKNETPATPTPGTGPVECNDDDFLIDEQLLTALTGLPSKVVAGSGFHTFQLDISNTSDTDYRRVDFGIFAAQLDERTWDIVTGHLTLQYQDPASGAWKNISLDENDEGAGYVGYSVVKANTSYSVNLRLSVDAAAPAGLGFAVSVGMYANDAGACVFAGDDSFYEFEVLKASATPGKVPGAKPQGGAQKPAPSIKPAGDTEIALEGTLAKTGSSSALPTIAVIGGVAMAVGLGAVFAVRRRHTVCGQAAV